MDNKSCCILSDDDADDEYVPLTCTSPPLSNVSSLPSPPLPLNVCVICTDMQFETEEHVHRHIWKVHPEIFEKYSFRKRKCKICRRVFKSHSFRGLLSHVLSGQCRPSNKRLQENLILPPSQSLPQEVTPTSTPSHSVASHNSYSPPGPSCSRQKACPSILCKSKNPNVNNYCKSCYSKPKPVTRPQTPTPTALTPPPSPSNREPLRPRQSRPKESADVIFSNMMTTGRSSAVKANLKNCPRIARKAKRIEKRRKALENRIEKEEEYSENDDSQEPAVEPIQGRLVMKIKKNFWDKVAKAHVYEFHDD